MRIIVFTNFFLPLSFFFSFTLTHSYAFSFMHIFSCSQVVFLLSCTLYIFFLFQKKSFSFTYDLFFYSFSRFIRLICQFIYIKCYKLFMSAFSWRVYMGLKWQNCCHYRYFLIINIILMFLKMAKVNFQPINICKRFLLLLLSTLKRIFPEYYYFCHL